MTILVNASDLHINSSVAICPPVVQLDEGGSYHASPEQHWLWKCWLDAWDTIAREYKNERKILVFGGDLGELDTKRRSYQIISPNKATILNMVHMVIEPAVQWADAVYIVRGTQAHVGKSAWLEETIANDLDNAEHSPAGASWWHILRKVEGLQVSISHHASMGRRDWTKLSGPAALAYEGSKHEPPIDLLLRSHNHRYVTTADNYPCQVYYVPCWSLVTEYAYRIGAELSKPDIGLLLFEIHGKQANVRRFKYEPKKGSSCQKQM